MKKVPGITVDPSMHSEKEGIGYFKVPIFSEEKDEYGEYQIIGYVYESV